MFFESHSFLNGNRHAREDFVPMFGDAEVVAADGANEWVDEALRNVPMPDGFLSRMVQMASELDATG